MSAVHTPGPWVVEGPDMFGDFNILHNADALAVAAVVSNMREPGEVAANARLIAAAPDLLAALTELLADTQHVRHNCGDPDCPVDVARQVISRATGGTA